MINYANQENINYSSVINYIHFPSKNATNYNPTVILNSFDYDEENATKDEKKIMVIFNDNNNDTDVDNYKDIDDGDAVEDDD